jgi:tRNA G37 N-methylase TrmD
VDNLAPGAIADSFRPFGCILAVYLDAVRRLSGEAAKPQSGSHHSASARISDAPAATRGKMTIPEKWTRSSGAAVASWRDMSSEDRENSVRKDITRRLKCICNELSIVEFQALVARMTSEQLRDERILPRWIAKN